MNKKLLCSQLICLVIGLFLSSISFAQDTQSQEKNWLLGVIFKLEKIRDDAMVKIKNADLHSLVGEEILQRVEKQITIFHIDRCWAEYLARIARIFEPLKA